MTMSIEHLEMVMVIVIVPECENCLLVIIDHGRSDEEDNEQM